MPIVSPMTRPEDLRAVPQLGPEEAARRDESGKAVPIDRYVRVIEGKGVQS